MARVISTRAPSALLSSASHSARRGARGVRTPARRRDVTLLQLWRSYRCSSGTLPRDRRKPQERPRPPHLNAVLFGDAGKRGAQGGEGRRGDTRQCCAAAGWLRRVTLLHCSRRDGLTVCRSWRAARRDARAKTTERSGRARIGSFLFIYLYSSEPRTKRAGFALGRSPPQRPVVGIFRMSLWDNVEENSRHPPRLMLS